MPMYEYRCEPCDHAFETLVRSAGDIPRCPTCAGTDLAKQFSVPAAARPASTSGQGSALPVCQPAGGPSFGCGGGGCGAGMCGMG